ncbi:hypothetical protein UCRNP2_9881 [Neofusicoccum parvum UCRNP2]|uniref:DUF7918 domain-containing protein n=1 Tax=Botryosphaeria parva (strain UCR-NP2) TaxID=1287680 RepID=R1GC43_BOTPV|nr:hypothetical protein UCRNP2_9881 [Neofusicoccum parvum UCRNP2]
MEYDNPAFPDRPNSATKYIEAVDGADFSVVIKFTARNSDLKDYSLGLCIYVDGTRVQGSVIDLKAHQFARECCLYHTQFERVQCVGEIKAKFYRVQEVGRMLNRELPET